MAMASVYDGEGNLDSDALEVEVIVLVLGREKVLDLKNVLGLCEDLFVWFSVFLFLLVILRWIPPTLKSLPATGLPWVLPRRRSCSFSLMSSLPLGRFAAFSSPFA